MASALRPFHDTPCFDEQTGSPPFATSPAAARARLREPALDFLFDRFGEETWRALRLGFFGGLSDGEVEDAPLLPEPLPAAIQERAGDWLLSEGVLELPHGPIAAFDLLLGPGGPELGAEARAWIAALGAQALALYEVGARTPDGHVCLRHALLRDRPLRRVREDPMTTAGLVRGEIIGARVVAWRGEDVLAGAIYPFPRKAVKILGGVRDSAQVSERDAPPAGGEEAARLVELFVSQAMAWLWLQGLVRSSRVEDGRFR